MRFPAFPLRQSIAVLLTLSSHSLAARDREPVREADILPLPAAGGESSPDVLRLLAQADASASPTPALVPPPLGDASAPAGKRSPSENVVINLINRLVEKGVLTKEDATALMQQAEQDAVAARIQAQADAGAAAQQALAARGVGNPAPRPSADAVRVTYVPEFVKRQIRDDLRRDVMAQARDENWASPRALPGWVTRWKLFGDLRVRYEGSFYPSGNDNTGAFPNFNAINTGAPFDTRGSQFSPQYNTDQDRTRFRLRARVGAEVDVGDNFTAGLRIGTGENNSPVTQNQTLGGANQGQGGNFSKYAIWLDRAFLKYQFTGQPTADVVLTAGRMDNPFFGTPMIWADDIGFDGVAAQGHYTVGTARFFGTVGAFPVFNTDLNFSSNRPAKFPSSDKYLYAAQFGVDWKPHRDVQAKVAAAYYHFDKIEGRLSTPYTPLTSADAGDTDNTRPSFAQRGNTYRALRDIVPTVDNNFGTTNQFQYFGLATPFRELALTARIDYNRYEPIQVSLLGEYARNLAFDKGAIDSVAVNNRGAGSTGSPGAFTGGNNAWFAAVRVGTAKFEKRWDWNASLGYRYVESDALVDAFVDSDFGGGGTNLKGFTASAAVALSPRVSLSLRWFSANSISGPRYNNDIIQFDLNAKF